MRGIISMEELAPNNGPCPRKRRASLNPLPPLKRHCKLSIFSQQVINVEDVDEDDFIAQKNDQALEEDVHTVGDESVNYQDTLSALPGIKEIPDSYPFVVYEGNVAIVKLGVGQRVMLDGCAMVQVVEGQASMLGYSFPRGTDVLVCSSPENGELSIIEAQHGVVLESMDVEMADGSCEETRRTLACQLRIASHTLGHNVLAPQAGLSFQLEFVPSPGGSRGKKRRRQFVDDEEFRGIKRTGRPG